MKKWILVASFLTASIVFSSSLGFFMGVAVSGTVFPYVGVRYGFGNLDFGTSAGFFVSVGGKDTVYLFSPEVSLRYFLTDNFFLMWNARVMMVFPFKGQIYLTGPGVGFSKEFGPGDISISVITDVILPVSAGKKAWDRGKAFPIPFVDLQYDLSNFSR